MSSQLDLIKFKEITKLDAFEKLRYEMQHLLTNCPIEEKKVINLIFTYLKLQIKQFLFIKIKQKT